jgi:ribosomal protein L27
MRAILGLSIVVTLVAASPPGFVKAAEATAASNRSAAEDLPDNADPKTLKERLGDKASDEQRVNNCKVPVDQRGTKPRPDRCD